MLFDMFWMFRRKLAPRAIVTIEREGNILSMESRLSKNVDGEPEYDSIAFEFYNDDTFVSTMGEDYERCLVGFPTDKLREFCRLYLEATDGE